MDARGPSEQDNMVDKVVVTRSCGRGKAGDMPQRLGVAQQEAERGAQLAAGEEAASGEGGGDEGHVQRLVVDAHGVALEQPVLPICQQSNQA